jgi:hypothetical protein
LFGKVGKVFVEEGGEIIGTEDLGKGGGKEPVAK